MEEKYKFWILNSLGVLFLVFGLGAIGNSLYLRNPMQVFWMCYISLTLIGIGILTRKSFFIASQLNILALPLIIWNIDFLYWILAGGPLWGITDYFFLERVFTLGKIISLQHLVTLPVGLYAIYLIGLERRDSWKWSMIQAVLVYVVVSLFTHPDLNVNCVFDPCINVYFGLPYRITWFLIFFGLIILTSFVINRMFVKNENKEKI